MRGLLLFAVIIFLAPVSAMADLLAGARMAQDLATFDFRQTNATPDEAWVVLRIEAAPSSGNIRFPGVAVGSGSVSVSPQARAEATVEGKAAVAEVLSGQPSELSWSYGWPFALVSPRGEDAALFSPFRKGGTAVALIRPKVAGAGRFARVILIPDEWLRWVTPARKFLQHQSNLFEETSSAQQRTRLIELLASENPFISVAAFRTLANDAKAPEALRKFLSQARGIQQGAFLYLTLMNEEARRGLLGEQLSRWPALTAQAQPRGLGLGAVAVYLQGGSGESKEAALEILRWLRRNQVFSAKATDENEDLVSFLNAPMFEE